MSQKDKTYKAEGNSFFTGYFTKAQNLIKKY